MQVHGAGDHLFARARFALNQHGGGARGDARQQLVDVEHRGTLPDERIRAHGVMLDDGKRNRRFAGRGAQPLQGTDQVVAAQRQGEHVQHAELLSAQRQSHRRRLRRRDQPRATRGGAQRIGPPRQLLVGALAQRGEDDVPPLARQQTHRPRQIGRRVHLQPAVVRPLPQTLEQGGAPRTFTRDDENPQARCPLLPRHRGQRRRLHPDRTGHPLVRVPPR